MSVRGVFGTEDPLELGEQRLEDRDRFAHASGGPVGAREVVSGYERVGVLGTYRNPGPSASNVRNVSNVSAASSLGDRVADVVALDAIVALVAGLQDARRAHADEVAHRLQREAVVE